MTGRWLVSLASITLVTAAAHIDTQLICDGDEGGEKVSVTIGYSLKGQTVSSTPSPHELSILKLTDLFALDTCKALKAMPATKHDPLILEDEPLDKRCVDRNSILKKISNQSPDRKFYYAFQAQTAAAKSFTTDETKKEDKKYLGTLTIPAQGDFDKLTAIENSTDCKFTPNQPENPDPLRSFSKTSVLFVSVSFIILMAILCSWLAYCSCRKPRPPILDIVISLAWLVFYYVQRFRYAHAKDRLARRLFNAAKKALTKIPTRALRSADKELDTDCPVCIEPYHQGDIIRTLPCKHVFHKTCVDPWLLEHRTCPMCKSDILKAFGYNLGHSEDSVRGGEEGMMDGVSAGGASSDGGTGSSGAAYAGYPYPVTDSDIHDPFFPSPAPSPSLVQQVVHQGNVSGFSIIPLTVHSSGGSVSRPSALTTPLSSSNPVLPPLGPRSSDSSAELPSPLCPVAGVEVHQHPLSSSSSSDSHGHSASCESSDSDSGNPVAAATGEPGADPAQARPLLSTSTEPLFRPRTARSPSAASAATTTALEWASVSSPAAASGVTTVVLSPDRRRSLAASGDGRRRAGGRSLRRGQSSGSGRHSPRFEPRRPPTKSSTLGSLDSL